MLTRPTIIYDTIPCTVYGRLQRTHRNNGPCISTQSRWDTMICLNFRNLENKLVATIRPSREKRNKLNVVH